ncbi:MAG: PqiC family protein [Myxococcota bacterium]
MTGRSNENLVRVLSRRSVFAILVLLTAAGCLGRSPEARHFILGASALSPPVEQKLNVAVLVGPIRLPAYLQRSQIATLKMDGEIELHEFDRWLGGFEENFARAMTLGLARELGSDRVVTAPSRAPFDFDYQVRLHVDDMIFESVGTLRLRIRWALMPKSQGVPPSFFVMDERFPVEGDEIGDLVRAHEKALMVLVRRIANKVVQLEAAP